MLTVCPKCALTLVVTAADLRAAQGYVRCGRCAAVFNALARLSEDRQSSASGASPEAGSAPRPPPDTASGGRSISPSPRAAPGTRAGSPDAPSTAAAGPVRPAPTWERSRAPENTPSPRAAPPAPPAAPRPPPSPSPQAASGESIPDEALEFDATDLSSVFVEATPDREWTAATGSFKAMAAAQAEPKPPEPAEKEIDAATLASLLTGETQEPEPGAAATPETPPAELAEASADANTNPVRTPAARERRAARHARPTREAAVQPPKARAGVPAESSEPSSETQSDPLLAEGIATSGEHPGEAVRPRRELWGAGAVLAVLVLLAQIVNHYRDDLAATTRLNQPLTALYTALGVRLAPHWDLHSYDVRQLGAIAEHGPAGHITVRASVKNAAQQPQPMPLLRVTLEDRFGNRIAARDVAPRFYLPRAIPETSFLSAGQRIDAEMGFVDPGANAVGFEIDACLPASDGGIACANDMSAH
ncbi:MAG TPA: DUF3426 domain-containing protein [Steroidobacteraceae bacterium]|nr:DUF3426 domain-containing protein [Steroidobacteraceae bacterium]